MLSVQHLSFTFPGRTSPSLTDICLEVQAGERVLITGPTGSGKSTLLRCLAGLIPHQSSGTRLGEVRVNKVEVGQQPLKYLARDLGLVLQSPDAQLFSTRVEDEVAFGLENLCLPRDIMQARLEASLEQVGLLARRHHEVKTLSGGQKQRLVLAAVLAMGPRLLLLDEPASQLDPGATQELMHLLEALHARSDLTLIMVEHRLEEVSRLVDRVILLNEGRVVLDTPAPSLWLNPAPLRELGLAVPTLPALFAALSRPERPLEVEEAARLLRTAVPVTVPTEPPKEDAPLEGPPPTVRPTKPLPRLETSIGGQARFNTCLSAEKGTEQPLLPTPGVGPSPGGAPLLEARGLSFRYHGDSPWVLREVTLQVCPGERVALMGSNGVGKSTLLHCLAGLQQPDRGQILRRGLPLRRPTPDIGLMFQDPDLMLLTDTVEEELCFGPRLSGLRGADLKARAAQAMAHLNLQGLASEPPLGLSRGQRLRVAVGAVLAGRPQVLLLDEPTTGQDREHVERLMQAMTRYPGLEALVFCTHDLGLALRFATRLVWLEAGTVRVQGPPREVLPVLEDAGVSGLAVPNARALARALQLDAFDFQELLQAITQTAGAVGRLGGEA